MATNKVSIDLELKGEKLVERGLRGVGDAAEDAGDDLGKMAKEASHLEKKTADLRGEVRDLIKEFDKTGDTELLKKIRSTNRELGQLDKLKRQLGKLDSGDSVAKKVVAVGADVGNAARRGFIGSLSDMGHDMKNAMGAAKGPAIAGAVALGLAITPFLGGVIASAVLGAAGAGGIVGGIFAASKDQRVQDAAKQVADHIGSALTDAGAPFVEPVIESLRLLDNAGDRLAKNFQEAGTKIAPVLVPLTKGLTGFVDEFMPGFVRSMEAAKPVIRVIAAELPKIGGSLSDFFDTVSEDPDGAIMAFKALSQMIQSTIEFTGELVATLSEAFEATQKWGVGAMDAVANVANVLQYINPLFGLVGKAASQARDNYQDQVDALNSAKDASGDYVGGGIQPIIRAQKDVAEATKTATEKIEDQIKAMDKMFGRFMDAQELASKYQEAIDDLTESVKENGRSLDPKDKAGRANLAALREQAEAIKAIREDMFRKTGDAAASDAAFDQMVEGLRKQATQLGLNKQAVDDFVNALKAIPAQTDVEVRAPGLLEAIARAQYLNHLLGSISAGARARGGDSSGYGGGRAGGGPMEAGKWYTVGENGVEIVQMHPGGGATVHSSDQTQAMMSGASGGSSGAVSGGSSRPVVSMTWVPSGNAAWDALAQAIWPYFLKQVRIDGGDLAAFGAA